MTFCSVEEALGGLMRAAPLDEINSSQMTASNAMLNRHVACASLRLLKPFVIITLESASMPSRLTQPDPGLGGKFHSGGR